MTEQWWTLVDLWNKTLVALALQATRPDPKVLASAVGAGLALGVAATVAAVKKGPDALRAVNERVRMALEKGAP